MTGAISISQPEVLAPAVFFALLRTEVEGGARLMSLFGRQAAGGADAVLTALFEVDDGVRVRRTQLPIAEGFHSLSRDLPHPRFARF